MWIIDELNYDYENDKEFITVLRGNLYTGYCEFMSLANNMPLNVIDELYANKYRLINIFLSEYPNCNVDTLTKIKNELDDYNMLFYYASIIFINN